MPSFLFTQQQKVKISTEYGNIILVLYDETPKHRDNFIKLVKEQYYNGSTFHRIIKNFMIQGGDPNSKDSNNTQLGNGGPGYTLPAEINPKYYHKKGALAAARLGDNINPKKESSGSQFYIVQGSTFTADVLKQMEQRKNSSLQTKYIRSFLNDPKNETYINKLKQLQEEKNEEAIKTFYGEIESIVLPTIPEKEKVKYSEEQIKTYTSIGGTPHLDGDYTVFGEVIEGLDVLDKIASVQTGTADKPLKDIKMTITLVK